MGKLLRGIRVGRYLDRRFLLRARRRAGRAYPHFQVPLTVGEGGVYQPVHRGGGRGKHLARHWARHGGGGLFDKLLRILHGRGDIKPLARPRQRHVEKAHLLRKHLPFQPQAYGVSRKAWVFYAPRGVCHLRAEAELRVHQHRVAAVLPVEAARRVAQEHHRELQPLGLVHRHYLHRRAAGRAARRLLAALV